MYIIIYMTFQKSMYRNSTWTVVNKLYIVKLMSESCYLIRPAQLLNPWRNIKWNNYGNWLQQLCHSSWFKLAKAFCCCCCDLFHVCAHVAVMFLRLTEALITAAFRIFSLSRPSASGLRFHTANLSQTKGIIQLKGHSSEWDVFL